MRAAGSTAAALLLGVAAFASATPGGSGATATESAPATASSPAPPSPAAPAFDADRPSFTVIAGDLEVEYATFLVPVLPDSVVPLRVPGPGGSSPGRAGGSVRVTVDGRPLGASPNGAWSWRAPGDPGVHRIVVRRAGATDSVVLNALVLVPFDRLRDGRVDGFRIGDYPERPYRGLERYRHPAGFVELTPELADLPVSPHFRLGQFRCHLPTGYPAYLPPPDPLMLEKLELMLAAVNRQGIAVSTFQVLSSYRSPWYNHAIGRPEYSRHIYGDAADIYIDRDGNGVMDDLNGDGRVDIGDAEVLYRIAEGLDGAPSTRHLLGGLGEYPVTESHGPFVHVDTRGYRARW